MNLSPKKYIKRLIDDKIAKYLQIFGAVSIEGPKWCGKTWTSLNHAKSVSYVTEQRVYDLANTNPKFIFKNEHPQLIDEWQIVPQIWDSVRHECDSDGERGKFILTGSTTLNYENNGKVFHSGTGRIAIMRMHTMSLFESGESTGEVSILDMLKGKIKEGQVKEYTLMQLANFIIRGGWPQNLEMKGLDAQIVPKSYLESIATKDIHERNISKKNPTKMKMVLRALARNESSTVGVKTLVNDIEEYEDENELIKSRDTVADYIEVLDSLYITANTEAFSLNYRSSKRVGKSAKRHLVDPSLSCAALNITAEKLLNDHETFGLMFEALAERDLRIYADFLDAHLYHFRDNQSGDEVDAILEFQNGTYAAFEIKLSSNSISDAIVSLQKFYKNVKKKPVFMCVIVGYLSTAYKDPESGIFVTPITALRP